MKRQIQRQRDEKKLKEWLRKKTKQNINVNKEKNGK